MSASTAKRLILYLFDRQPLEALGYADGYLKDTHVEVITRDGNLQMIDYNDVKAVCFVSEGAAADLFDERNTFERRPKLAGLWARFRFRDDAVLEGVLAHNLAEWPKQGYLLTPPKSGANRQRVFVPRQAVQETVLRGVIGAVGPVKEDMRSDRAAQTGIQLNMFD